MFCGLLKMSLLGGQTDVFDCTQIATFLNRKQAGSQGHLSLLKRKRMVVGGKGAVVGEG
jgi:hypothetical protein